MGALTGLELGIGLGKEIGLGLGIGIGCIDKGTRGGVRVRVVRASSSQSNYEGGDNGECLRVQNNCKSFQRFKRVQSRG